jgi:protease IV
MLKKTLQYLSIIFISILIIQLVPNFIKTIKEEYLKMAEPKTKVGVVCINDMIKDSDKTIKSLKEYFENKEIKSILLKINSQGGYAGSSESIFLEILNLKKEHPKPIITLVENICASGAYLIACSTDYIITTPSATIGSIGSYLGYFRIKELLEQYKIKFEIQKSGKYKGMGNPFTDIDKDGEELLQNLSNDCYKIFLDNVAQTRKLSLKNKDIWAEGKIFTGSQALKIGLVDELGTNYHAIKKIKDLALIDTKIEWIQSKKESWIEKLTKGEDDCCMSKVIENAIVSFLSKKIIIN